MHTASKNRQQHYEQRLCPICDLLVHIPPLAGNSKASCPRCKTTLSLRWQEVEKKAAMYSTSALIMLILACLFPFVSMKVAGIFTQISLLEIPQVVLHEGYFSLALLFTFLVLILPITCMVLIPLILLTQWLPLSLRRKTVKLLFFCKNWCMVEIFLVGIFVSFVKLMTYGEIGVGSSFIPYTIFCLLQLKSLQLIDNEWIWRRVSPLPKHGLDLKPGITGLRQGARSCSCCTAILPIEQRRCPRCLTRGYARKKNSLQLTMAFLFTAIILYIPANTVPIMVTEALGEVFSSTIMSGVLLLWDEGSYPVALIIFIASVMVPSLKIIAIAWLCWNAKYGKTRDSEKMAFIYSAVEFIGRWSMIDVFVIAVLSTLVKMGRLMGVYPDTGAIIFAAVVILTMLSSMMYDPRLSWDPINNKHEKGERELDDATR